MLNSSGTLVANYSYNAWGEIISVTNANGVAITSSTHIANLNPLRYRGYYYDIETGFYYLQSRYYDPVTIADYETEEGSLSAVLSTSGAGFTVTNELGSGLFEEITFGYIPGEEPKPPLPQKETQSAPGKDLREALVIGFVGGLMVAAFVMWAQKGDNSEPAIGGAKG